MRITLFLLLATILQSYANDAYSQKTRLSLDANNQKLVDVLDDIENNSEFFFLYNEKLIDTEREVSISVNNRKIDEILDEFFAGTDVVYKIADRKIILAPSYLSESEAGWQQNSVSGKVTDDTGQPLPGVTVVVKGTTQGTVTNADGDYTLANIPENTTLQFSFVGMRTQEIAVGNQTRIDVRMMVDAIGLEEVVAIGYGVQKKANLSGSVSNVNVEELNTVPTPTLAQSIMGRASGVFIKNVNAQPGESKTEYNIRGFGTPLLIIDGMPSTDNDFKQLDPNDIEDFSVLKDAASAAVYGARAGNGVILVTTKRGNISDATVTYTGNYSKQFFAVVPDYVNSEQYARMENLSRYNEGLDPIWTEDIIQKFADGSDPKRYPDNDWWNLTLRKYAPQTQHNINVRGGTENVKYFVSGGYFYQEALLRVNDTKYKKYNLRSNLDIKLSEKLNMDADIDLTYQDFIGPMYQLERDNRKVGIMTWLARQRPYAPSHKQYPESDKLTSFAGNDISPVIYSRMEDVGYRSWNKLTGDVRLSFSYQLPFNIEAKVNYRLYRRYDSSKWWELKTPVYSYDWDSEEYSFRQYLNDPQRLEESRQVNNNLNQQYFLSWENDFNEHSVNALAVYEILADDYNWISASRIRYEYNIDYLFAGPQLDMANDGSVGQGGRKGLITRVNYGYKGKYLLEFNSRYDASPRFPKETRWGFFPSASIAWRISEENFIKDNFDFVSNLKLRGSYGKLGYDNTGQYQYLETYRLTSSYIYDETTDEVKTGIRADAIPNPNITWEKMSTTNVGVDFNFWESKLGGSFDYFYRKRTDVLGSRMASMPNTVGASLPQVNYAEYDNRGFELELSHDNQIGDFQYNIGGNIAWNREKTIFVDQNEFASKEARRRGNRIGEWTDNFWGVMTDGFFQSKEEIESWADQDGRNNATILPGDVKKIDYNGDGRITSEDEVIIGRGSYPKLFFGANMSLIWNSFDFSMLWQGAGLFDVDVSRAPDYRFPFYAGNTPLTYMLNEAYVPEDNPWLPANTTNANFPLYRTDNFNRRHGSYSRSEFWLVDGTYIRLKNVQLGYTLPNTFLGKWGIDQCKFYVSGYNVLTFSALTKFQMDPEIDTSPARTVGTYYAPVGTYNLGVILKF